MKTYLCKTKIKENDHSISSFLESLKDEDKQNACGLDPTTFIRLESLLTGEDYYSINENKDKYYVTQKGVDGSALIKTSSSLVDSLEKLTEDKKSEILFDWCGAKEVKLHKLPSTEVAVILNWLIETSQDCQNSEDEILMVVEK